jgi:hypothetical protein
MTTRDTPPSAQEPMPSLGRSDPLTVDTLAAVLQEPNVPLLRQVMRVLGADRTTALLTAALQCEAAGGMLTRDGTRRRTPGGTFLQLMKDRVTSRQRWWLFAPKPARPRRRPPPDPQTPTWEDVQPLVEHLATTRAGEARIMKLTLIGRPGKIETRKDCVLLRMQGKAPTNFPKGLPPVPKQAPLTWSVMVALRQWNRVKGSLTADKEDQLIIEGYPAMQGTEHVLLAQSCTSVAVQRAQKAAQGQVGYLMLSHNFSLLLATEPVRVAQVVLEIMEQTIGYVGDNPYHRREWVQLSYRHFERKGVMSKNIAKNALRYAVMAGYLRVRPSTRRSQEYAIHWREPATMSPSSQRLPPTAEKRSGESLKGGFSALR